MSGRKDDTDKPPMSLLDRYALEQIANVLAFGAKKYAKHNWRKGLEYSRLLDAALRHLLAFADGEDNDPESGFSHIAHAGCCIMFLLWMSKNRTDLDDRHRSCTHGAFQNYNGVRFCHWCREKLPEDQQPWREDNYLPVDPDLVKSKPAYDVVFVNHIGANCGYNGCELPGRHVHFRNNLIGVLP